MHSYKYEVLFEPEGSTSISFKEYNILKASPAKACERMFFRMDKDLLIDGNPCEARDCTCQDTSDYVTIINPLYAKVLKEKTSNSMISQYAVDIFSTMKKLLEVDFVESVKALFDTNWAKWRCAREAQSSSPSRVSLVKLP